MKLPAYLCIFSPKHLGLATHAYSLYNSKSRNQAEQLFLSDPAKRMNEKSNEHVYFRQFKFRLNTRIKVPCGTEVELYSANQV